jgi:hypothetical protein
MSLNLKFCFYKFNLLTKLGPLALTVFILTTSDLFSQKAIYVFENGSDNNSGYSINTPLKTLKAAYDKILTINNKISESYTIYLDGKIYPGNSIHDVPFYWLKSGTSQYSLTIRSYNSQNKAHILRNSIHSSKNEYITYQKL